MQSVPPSIPYTSGTPLNLVQLRTHFSTSLLYVYQFHQFPSGLVYTRKTLPGTSFSDLQRLFDLNMKNTLSNLPGVIVMYISSTSSLLVLPIPKKNTTSFAGIQRLFDLNMKNTSKLHGENCYLYHPELILDDTICGSPL